ncbi:helix-turn-helix domain-containing protein [Humibacillus xanthopallidus]|uniref:Xre family transcriptional regulator n=1 Tax=Humibacillus xanthopallidus TaxID=412689 RepID=A0A543HGE3_9MICO|nr:helix-turn-helix transcriptional regulator [Humibacillus xanthopallidus]TQM57347.1 Xre family transcriptional regulator [Humibacillus xanthopallidus]
MAGATSARTPVAVARALDGLGRDVTTWRKLRHLTVEQVADRAGVSRSTVLRLESGQGSSVENLLRVTRALGVLDLLTKALDPYATDVGRLRADEELPTRVRPRGAGR